MRLVEPHMIAPCMHSVFVSPSTSTESSLLVTSPVIADVGRAEAENARMVSKNQVAVPCFTFLSWVSSHLSSSTHAVLYS